MIVILADNSTENKRVYRLIDKRPLCAAEKRVGYCWSDIHPGFLTKQLMEEHECIEKKCPSFEKFKDAPYWKYRERIKKKRMEKKALTVERNERCKAILKQFRALTDHIEGFAVADVHVKNNLYYVRCVAIKSVDLKEYIKAVAKEYNVRILVYFVQNRFVIREELIGRIKQNRDV